MVSCIGDKKPRFLISPTIVEFDKKIISVFGGGSESGRRALGIRSILADPTHAETKDIVKPKAFKLKPKEETLTDMVEKAKIIKNALTKKLLPERTKCFLCDSMCPYATKCFTDERESFEE